MPGVKPRVPGGVRIVASVALASSLALMGCSGAPAQGGGGTVRVQVEASKLAGFQAVADGFQQANPGLHVEYETITSDQKATTNGLTLASQDAPDLGLAPINATSYSQLRYGGALLPLDDVWDSAKLRERYDKSTIDSLAPNGSKPYSVVPEKQLYNIVYYNKKLLEGAKATPPSSRQIQSQEELYSMASQVKKAGQDFLCIGGTSNYQLGWLFDGQLATSVPNDQLNAYLAAGQPNAQKVNFNDPGVLAALNQIQQWGERGVFQTGFLGQNYDNALANFSAGKCAALLGTATTVSALTKNGVTFAYDWMLLPGVKGPTLPNTYTGSTLVIPKSAKNPDGAKAFLKYLMSVDAQKAYVKANGTLPAVNDIDPAELSQILPASVTGVLEFTKDKGASLGWTSVVPGEMGQAFIDPAIQRQLNREKTVDRTAADLQKAYEDFVAKSSQNK